MTTAPVPNRRFDASDKPLVSVIIPTYEDTEYLPDALRSVAGQTYGHVEAIVVDSSGDAEPIVADLDWVEYHYQEPNGPAAARNLGIEHADGEYIAFLDADDKWLPEKLRRQVARLETSDAQFVYSDQYVHDL